MQQQQPTSKQPDSVVGVKICNSDDSVAPMQIEERSSSSLIELAAAKVGEKRGRGKELVAAAAQREKEREKGRERESGRCIF
jgi:hypothetical protein